MQCPYCFGAAHEEASRCPHCRSEIGVFRPLLARIDALQARVEALEARCVAPPSGAAFGTTGASKSTVGGGAEGGAASGMLSSLAFSTPPARAKPAALAAWGAATVGTLGALHVLLLFVLDVNPLLLRVATLVLPLLLGLAALRRHAARPLARAVFSLAVAITAVAAMLALTAALDGVPFWPETARDRQESLEYALGIALAHFGGGLLPWSWRRLRTRRVVAVSDDRDGSPTDSKGRTRARVVATAARLRQGAAAIAPVASCATAFYSGLKSYLGH